MRPLIALLLAAPLVFAGCVTPPEVDAAATTANDALLPTSTVDTPFAFEGSYGTGVFACAVVTCVGQIAGASTWQDIDIASNLTALALTMTWDAASPSMETLRFGISWNDGEEFEYVEGGSPLVFELDGLSVKPADKPYVWAWIVTPAPMGIATVSTPQDFSIEGTLTTVA